MAWVLCDTEKPTGLSRSKIQHIEVFKDVKGNIRAQRSEVRLNPMLA